MFGLAAGLTEGNAFLPRPKEHWFLIWIPMALLYALWIQQRFAASRRGEDTAAP